MLLAELEKRFEEMEGQFKETKLRNLTKFDELRSEIMDKNERRFLELRTLILKAKIPAKD